MAIIARRLVESHPWFQGKRIAFNPSANLSGTDSCALTTIVNLYDILTIIFSKIAPRRHVDEMKYYRPTDIALEEYYGTACEYFSILGSNFPSLAEYFRSIDFPAVVKKHRGSSGGNVLFRPIGLSLMTEVIVRLSKSRTLPDAVEMASRLPIQLSAPPYLEVLWDRRKGMSTQKALVRDLLLYMLGELPAKSAKTAGGKYARALQMDPMQWQEALQTLPAI